MSATDHTTAEDLRQRFHGVQAPASDVTTAIREGRRQLRDRRWRRGLGAGLPAALAIGLVAALPNPYAPQYELAGTGLTLAEHSSPAAGPVQVSDDRVDLGDGVQAWRAGNVLSIGYPGGPHAFLDTSDITAQWGNLGYDAVVFDDPGQNDGSTVIVGTVQGAPSSVRVTLNGITEQATIACFEQARGWCSYKVTMPTSIRTHESSDLPTVAIE